MAYTPPAGNAVDFQAVSGYVPQAGDSVGFVFAPAFVIGDVDLTGSIVCAHGVVSDLQYFPLVSGAATGETDVRGQVYNKLDFVITASGDQPFVGAVDALCGFSVTAISLTTTYAEALGTMVFSANAQGIGASIGEALGSVGLTAAAAGFYPEEAHVDITFAIEGYALGSAPPVGPVAGSFVLTGSGSGVFGSVMLGAGVVPLVTTIDARHGRCGTAAGAFVFNGAAGGSHGIAGGVNGVCAISTNATGQHDTPVSGAVEGYMEFDATALGVMETEAASLPNTLFIRTRPQRTSVLTQ